jgi:ATP-grasp domain
VNRILYVNVIGGPPFDYVIDRLRTFGEIYVLQPEAMSAEEERQLRSLVDHVQFVSELPPAGNFQAVIIDYARRIGATLLFTFDEFYLRDVSEAAAKLGLRGPGPRVGCSVNKVEIYRRLERFDLLKRAYLAATDAESILTAQIPIPFVIKPSECAGSLGVFAVRTEAELRALPERLAQAERSVERVADTMASNERLRGQAFIREGMLIGDAGAWFGPGTPFADYISVEGMVLNGRYHPLAITQNFPLLDPFIETVSLSPTTLPMALQRKIIDRLRPCIESFELGTCGTHTEIKLLQDQEFAVIETAARFAGWSIVPQISSVFGIDPVGELIANLLDPTHTFELGFEDIYDRRAGAAATINLLPINDDGRPWERVVFRQAPDLASVIEPGSQAVFTPYITLGDPIEPLSVMDGAWNSFGKAYLTARDVSTLCEDIRSVRRRLRHLIE